MLRRTSPACLTLLLLIPTCRPTTGSIRVVGEKAQPNKTEAPDKETPKLQHRQRQLSPVLPNPVRHYRPNSEQVKVYNPEGWHIEVTPNTVSAQVGDEVGFTVTIRPTRPGVGSPTLMSAGRRVQFLSPDDGDMVSIIRLSESGGRVEGIALAAPDDWLQHSQITAFFDDRKHNDALDRFLVPLPLIQVNMGSAKKFLPARIHKGCGLPRGITVTAENSRINVLYSTGESKGVIEFSHSSHFYVRDINKRPTIFGFVVEEYSDLMIAPETTSICESFKSWSATVGTVTKIDRPGPVDVRIYSSTPRGLERHLAAFVVSQTSN